MRFLCVYPIILFFLQTVESSTIDVEWDPVDDERVTMYELSWGTASGVYPSSMDTVETTATVSPLTEGLTYYVVARACTSEKLLCSEYSQDLVAYIPVGPDAAFAADVVEGVAPLAVQFTDESTGDIATRSWDLGDGTSSNEQHPSHTYQDPGVYTVSLTVEGPGGESTVSNTDYITANWPPPEAVFTASPESGEAPLLVTFTDESLGNTETRAWDLGDGAQVSDSSTVVHTYTVPGDFGVTLTVTGLGGADTATRTIVVREPPPVASFSEDPSSGPAPLMVRFTDTSTGVIDTRSWTFGDGAGSSAQHPSHTYTEPGSYTVELAVANSGGADMLSRTIEVTEPGPPIEAGTVEADDQWRWVAFEKSFAVAPVVVAKPASLADSDPATVRVKDITAEGFYVRVQEWDYLNGTHALEAVSYLAMEPGRHQLDDGTMVEAGTLTTDATGTHVAVSFVQPFAIAPVVVTAVMSENGPEAVVTRNRNVTGDGFQVGMAKQESLPKQHAEEEIGYIAWPESSGILDGLRYEVSRTGNVVTHGTRTIAFTTWFAEPPHFVADMQTTDGGDASNLRLSGLTAGQAQLYVAEEQSRDLEMNHTTENVGYMIFEVE